MSDLFDEDEKKVDSWFSDDDDDDGFFGDEEDLDRIFEDEEEIPIDPFAEGTCSVEDSLYVCLNEVGKVDIKKMASLAGVSEQEILECHAGRTILQDPDHWECYRNEYGGWVLLPQYLRGNLEEVRKRLETYVDKYPDRFDRNLELVEEAMPKRPKTEDIYIGLGASWISERHIENFLNWLFHLKGKVSVKRMNSRWNVGIASHTKDPSIFNVMYGTDKMSADQIVEHILNASTIQIYDTIKVHYGNKKWKKKIRKNAGRKRRWGEGSKESMEIREMNRKETEAAEKKAETILRAFQEWLADNPDEREEMVNEYWDRYAYVMPRYDGSFLTFPGINPEITLRNHQKNAVLRILLSPNTLLCHEVGAGKTFEFVAGVHELYRMGISKRNMIVVPNATFKSTIEEHRKLYPEDKLIEIGPGGSFPKKERKEAYRRVREEDYVAVYIAYSWYDRLSMSKEYVDKKSKEKERDIRERAAYQNEHGNRYISEYEIQKKIDRENKHLEKLYRPDSPAYFDELGITALVVDECQNYKNLHLITGLRGVIGLNTEGSLKANLNLEKVKMVQAHHGHVVFATGTLLTNSISDLFAFQTYLEPEFMEDSGIATFGQWMNTFGERSTAFEIDIDGRGSRMRTRFDHFNNMPELMAMFAQVCDFYSIDREVIALPEFKKYEDVSIPLTKEQEEYYDELVNRADEIRAGAVPSTEDNLLKVISDGRKVAVDIRTVKPEVAVSPDECKAGVCAKKVYEIYKEYPERTQIVFCDFSTPKKTFNEYDELKKNLAALGIPEKEIAFIHEATSDILRLQYLKNLDKGKIRVMVGSTLKLGVGVNVQSNLIALHHVDAPWRPSDLTQREGRMIRQGNTNEEVFQFRYVCERSFDAYVWQILESKQRFIGAFQSGSEGGINRREEEIDEVRLSMSQIKMLAIGDPLIRERFTLTNQLEQLNMSRDLRVNELRKLALMERKLERDIEEAVMWIGETKKDLEHYRKNREKQTKEERQETGEVFLEALADNAHKDFARRLDTYMGFYVNLPSHMDPAAPFVLLQRPEMAMGKGYQARISVDDPMMVTRILDGVLIHGIPARLKRHQAILERCLSEKANVIRELSTGNQYDEEVKPLKLRIEEIDKVLEKRKNVKDIERKMFREKEEN